MSQEKQEGPRLRKEYREEFRRSVADHWQTSGRTGAQVTQEFRVNIWNLRNWKRQYGPVARLVDGLVPQTPEQMSREIQQLQKELARVMMQRDILRETMGIRSES